MDNRQELFKSTARDEKNAVLFERTSNLNFKDFERRVLSYPDSIINQYILSSDESPFTMLLSMIKNGSGGNFPERNMGNAHKIVSPGLNGLKNELEDRKGQTEMMEDAYDIIDRGSIFIAEAPPGTGKSMAYLVPIVKHLKEDARFIISTNTKHLQTQLFEQDVLIASRYASAPFSVSVIKGIGNYLCFLKYDENRYKIKPLMKLALDGFTHLSQSGDLSEMKFFKDIDSSDITADSEYCPDRECPFSKICYFLNIREHAKTSQIVITNHFLTLIDSQMANGILGNYGGIVFDEAHNLENVITEVFTYEFDFMYVRRTIHYCISSLVSLRRAGRTDRAEDDAALHEIEEELSRADENIEVIEVSVKDRVSSMKEKRGEFTQDFFTGLQKRIQDAASALYSAAEKAHNAKKDMKHSDSKSRLLKYISEKFQYIFISFTSNTEIDSTHFAYYYKWDEKRYNVILNAAPIETGGFFFDNFISREKTPLIFTSATLQKNGDYSMFEKQTGLNRTTREVIRQTYESSFDFSSQMSVTCVNGMGDPNSAGFLKKSTDIVGMLAKREKRMFVLSTSYQQIEHMKKSFSDKRFIFQKREDVGERLLNEFRKKKGAVLIGTNMFWEGVDLPGDLLEIIVILKMPFAVPDDPVIRLRCEALSREGIDPFENYSLPSAIMKLKQGMGRLIRKKDDIGEIYILDERIIKKRYGRQVMDSLYVKPRVVDYEEIVEE